MRNGDHGAINKILESTKKQNILVKNLVGIAIGIGCDECFHILVPYLIDELDIEVATILEGGYRINLFHEVD